MHKKQYIKVGIGMVLFTVILVFILVILVKNPIGIISNYETYKGNRDLLVGKIYVTEYVKEKYGFEPEITYIQPVMSGLRSDILPIFRQTYSGKVLSECCVNGENFDTVIRISDRAGCDNYQKEEIINRIKTEVQKLEGLEYNGASYSYRFMSESKAYYDKAEEYYDENTDLKEFLKPLNFQMELRSDIDLEKIDYAALCRMFPEEGVDICKRFPEGEHWSCFRYQQRKCYYEYGDTEIRKYAPKLVGVIEVSACDGSDFTVEEGVILQGEWEGNPQTKFDLVESPVYTCRFDGYKEVEIGRPNDWWEKREIETGDGIYDMFYQYRDEAGKIRCHVLTNSIPDRVYTDMLTIMYGKIVK